MKACHYCNTSARALRPYGPNASWVCFDCATATPEREKQAESMFYNQLNAIKGPALIGTENGPTPLTLVS